MKSQRLAIPLPKGVKRREWKSGHGYRKFFKTRAEQVMKPANVELLSGRDIGVSGSYYKPTEKELFEDYTKAIYLLTINENNKKLEREFIELKEKSKDNEDIIRSGLQEKDEQIESLRSEMRFMREIVNKIISSP
jgi:phage anti-repressor protein